MVETEVLVIGGGIAGAATAFHLTELGRAVTLVERGEIAGEASGVNAGSINVLGWGALPDLQAYLTAGSLQIFKRLQLDLGHDFELRVSGGLQAIHTAEQYAWSRDRALGLRAQGYSVELLTAREARSLEPAFNGALPGAVYYPLSAQANPARATRAFADAATNAGARVLTGCDVTGIAGGSRRGWRVVTARGEIHAGVLVVAAGAWCPAIGTMFGLRIPIVPVRGQMWATAPIPPRVFLKIGSVESYCDWARHSGADLHAGLPPEITTRQGKRLTRHLYGRQTRDGEIVIGGDRDVVGLDRTPDPSGIEVNRAHAAEALPFLRELPIARTWAGLMPFSLDGRPLIGRLPAVADAYIVSGLASSGFGRGPMAGKLLADFIHTGDRPSVLAEADPARCITPV